MANSKLFAFSALVLVAIANAQVAPTIESDRNDIMINAPNGKVQLQSNGGCSIGSDEICKLQTDLATMTASMTQLQAKLKSTTDKLATAVASLVVTPDTDDGSSSVGSYTQFVLDQVTDVATKSFTDATYVAMSDASNFVQQSDFETVAANQGEIQQRLVEFQKEIKAALAKVENATKLPDIPMCEGFPSFANGIADKFVEHVAGTVVTLSCKESFQLVGSKSALCLSSGTWHTDKKPSCEACKISWKDLATKRNNFGNFTGGASPTSKDMRSGNPRGETSMQLQPYNVDGPIYGISFSYQYVNGYGTTGDSNTAWTDMRVYIVDADDFLNRVKVYDTKESGQEMGGYSYDNCCQRVSTCWGSESDANDGCYSNRINVKYEKTTPILKAKKRAYVLFEFNNNARNVHINDDAMEMKVSGMVC